MSQKPNFHSFVIVTCSGKCGFQFGQDSKCPAQKASGQEPACQESRVRQPGWGKRILVWAIVTFLIILPDRQTSEVLREFKLQKICNQYCSSKAIFRASYSTVHANLQIAQMKSILRTAEVSPRLSLLRDVTRGGTSATQ